MIKKLFKNILLALLVPAILVPCDAMKPNTKKQVCDIGQHAVGLDPVIEKGNPVWCHGRPLVRVKFACDFRFLVHFFYPEVTNLEIINFSEIFSYLGPEFLANAFNRTLKDRNLNHSLSVEVNRASGSADKPFAICIERTMTPFDRTNFLLKPINDQIKLALWLNRGNTCEEMNQTLLRRALVDTLKELEVFVKLPVSNFSNCAVGSSSVVAPLKYDFETLNFKHNLNFRQFCQYVCYSFVYLDRMFKMITSEQRLVPFIELINFHLNKLAIPCVVFVRNSDDRSCPLAITIGRDIDKCSVADYENITDPSEKIAFLLGQGAYADQFQAALDKTLTCLESRFPPTTGMEEVD